MGRQRCAGRLQWLSLCLVGGTAEALRCQPGLLMCWDCGCTGIADVLGLLMCWDCGCVGIADDDDKIRLNQRKPSKYKGLRRFGPEKNLQRINKFMKERPIFYKNLIQMKENIRFYLRCFYCITKVMILQFNSENRTELARNG